VPVTLLFWIAGPSLIDVMTTAPEVRAEARTYLPWVVAAPLIGIASWMLDGIFFGATRIREMLHAMFSSLLAYLAALFVLVPAYENHGLWLALMVLNVTRAITLGLRYSALEKSADENF
jgi:MATE family multidrug resistance protein